MTGAPSEIPEAPPARGEAAQPVQRSIEVRIGRTLGILLTVLAAAAVAVLVWQVLAHLAHLLVMLVLAVLVAFIFAPAVGALERRGLPRAAAIALAYVGSMVLLAGGLTLLLGPLIAQLAALAGQMPEQVRTLQGRGESIDRFFGGLGLPVRVGDVQRQLLDRTEAIGTAVLGSTLGILGGLAGFVIDFFLVLVLSFYLLLDSAKIHDNLMRLVPERWRAQAFFVEAAAVKVVGGYIRGQLVMALTIGLAAGVGCWLLGVPYPLVIGLLAGVFELIPMLGPILSAVPAVLISLTQPFPQVLWVIGFFFLIQQVEANVIGPRITGHAVGLHPLGALLALLAGVELGGLFGALFAVPVAGILYVLAVAVYWQWQGQAIPAVPERPAPFFRWTWGQHRHRPAATLAPRAATLPADPVIAAAATAATAGGDTVPRPETLASLDREAEQLRGRFEQTERERQEAQTEKIEQAKQIEEARAAGEGDEAPGRLPGGA